MTASSPILDPRATRVRPDWLVYVRGVTRVDVHRFSDEVSARDFAYSINEGIIR